MSLPQQGLFLFRKSPLRLVVGQVRFPVLTAFADPDLITGFHRAIRAAYPRVDRELQAGFELSARGVEPKPGQALWRFATRDQSWSVVLGETAVTLEAYNYSTFGELRTRFKDVLSASKSTLEITERLRLGLRYVNELRLPTAQLLADWANLLKPEFVGFAGTDLFDGQVEHSMQEIRWRRSDGILAIRHGLLTGTVVLPRPNQVPPTSRFYLIDLDYYDPTECELDVAQTLDAMREYNRTMYQFFCWTLGEELRESLEPEPCP